MEGWKREFEWLRVRHYVAKAMQKDKLPDLQTVLFLIGVQELGRWTSEKFTKEEKQDCMHIAVCTLLEDDGYYEFVGRDHDGWPHFKSIKPFDLEGLESQEVYLTEKVIQYFAASIEDGVISDVLAS